MQSFIILSISYVLFILYESKYTIKLCYVPKQDRSYQQFVPTLLNTHTHTQEEKDLYIYHIYIYIRKNYNIF